MKSPTALSSISQKPPKEHKPLHKFGEIKNLWFTKQDAGSFCFLKAEASVEKPQQTGPKVWLN